MGKDKYMSILYTFDVYLDAWPTETNILKILTKGEALGIRYYDHIEAERYIGSPELNSIEATKKVLFKREQPDKDQGLYIRKENSTGFFWFSISPDKTLCFSMGSFSEKKERYYDIDLPTIDTAYYLRLAIDLCDDFFINKIEVIRI